MGHPLVGSGKCRTCGKPSTHNVLGTKYCYPHAALALRKMDPDEFARLQAKYVEKQNLVFEIIRLHDKEDRSFSWIANHLGKGGPGYMNFLYWGKKRGLI